MTTAVDPTSGPGPARPSGATRWTAATGCPPPTPRSCWTPTTPPTPGPPPGGWAAWPRCCSGSPTSTAAARASPTRSTAPTAGWPSPTSTGPCSSTTWPAGSRPPELDGRLRAEGARALDVGCGVGWSSISLARAYPSLRVDGIDSDGASIADAERNAAEAGVADRVRFQVVDAAELEAAGGGGSTSPSAGGTACRPAGPRPRRRPPGRPCARARCATGPTGPASPASGSCPSTTSSGASTSCADSAGYQRPRWTTWSSGRRGRVRAEPLGRSSAAG
jgi:hypothetical protein